nr:MAG: replication associated protein [Cressdnaviricota sp.]
MEVNNVPRLPYVPRGQQVPNNITARNYCFTSYLLENDLLERAALSEGLISFLIYQLERGDDEGRLHYQGYIELSKPSRYAAIKRLLGDEALHLEVRRGTQDQAIDYCRKAETKVEGPWEHGTRSKQGKRNDLTALVTAVKSGQSVAQMLNDETLMTVAFKHIKHIQTIQSYIRPTRTDRPAVYILHGEPGSGKTRTAHDFDTDLWTAPGVRQDGVWFNGYDKHLSALLDDVQSNSNLMSRDGWLRLLDRYVYQVPTKGGFTWWLPKTIFITTNCNHWWQLFGCVDRELAFSRRITAVIEFNTGQQPIWRDPAGNAWNGPTVFLAGIPDEPQAQEALDPAGA